MLIQRTAPLGHHQSLKGARERKPPQDFEGLKVTAGGCVNVDSRLRAVIEGTDHLQSICICFIE